MPALVLMLAFHLAGCTSSPPPRDEANAGAELSEVRSFDFLSPLSTDSGDRPTLLSRQLMNAATALLEQRGWSRDAEDPDVLINFLLESADSAATAAGAGLHRSGRYSMRDGSPPAPSAEQLAEGMLSIDLVDPQQNQLIWEGSVSEGVTDQFRRNQAAAAESLVAEILRDLP